MFWPSALEAALVVVEHVVVSGLAWQEKRSTGAQTLAKTQHPILNDMHCRTQTPYDVFLGLWVKTQKTGLSLWEDFEILAVYARQGNRD